MEDYSLFLEKARKAALKAGEMVRSKRYEHHQIQSKSRFDFVTEVDGESERLITGFLKECFPDHLFFGEETISSSSVDEDTLIDTLPCDRYIWVIDPIDGTTNFIRGIPLFAISIALVRDRKVVVGVVYDISRDLLYYTCEGEKSYCNDREIHVSEVSSFDKAIAITSFPAYDIEARNTILSKIMEKGRELMSLRIYNCAALAACSVAAGETDIYVELGIHLWDFSAGKLLIENAGGRFSDVDGRAFHMHERDVLATNGKLYERTLEAIES